jgi:hypothetical protein
MANDNKQTGAADAQAQKADADRKKSDTDEIQHFDTTITKLVERDVPDEGTDGEDGKTHKEWVEVMSDNLYPGEKLKREADEEQNDKKAQAARKERAKAAKNDEHVQH